jgi:hypothetical protein
MSKMNDELFANVIADIAANHRKIIDDWCKAYLAQLYEDSINIKPGCFTLNEQVPTLQNNNFVKKYWFEPGTPDYPKPKEWIKISDHLPELDKRVLTWNGNRVEIMFRAEILDGSIHWVCEEYIEWNNITHWHYLPEFKED